MKRLVLIFAILTFMMCGYAHAYENGDFQIWQTDTEELKISKDLKAGFEQEFRWGKHSSEFYYHHYDFGIFYSINKYLNIGAGYRQVYELGKGKFMPEEEPYATITLSMAYKGFSLDSRNRMEYRYFNYKDDTWRYRNKCTLKFPWKFTPLAIQPFVSDEVLIDFESKVNGMNENRLAAGIGMDLVKNIKGEIYYMWRTKNSLTKTGDDKWYSSNVLGLKLKVVF